MRFAMAEEAAALRDAADALLDARATADLIRSAWPGRRDATAVPDLWRELAAAGLAGALVPEDAGGLGLDENALVPVLIRLGYRGLPLPVVETVAVAAPLLAAARHPGLPDVLSGAALVTARLETIATAGLAVPFWPAADYAVLPAGDGLRVYQRSELDAELVPSVDGSRQIGRLRAAPAGGTTLAVGADAGTAWRRGVLGTAALLVGLAERMLSLTVGYVASRRQFGVPVGSFQAVKHRLADAYVAIEFARPAVLAAGWAQAAAAADADEQTSVAKALASDAACAVARAAIQGHGAIGYTTEYDLHLYAKRAWALAAAWGSAPWHRRRLAAALGLAGERLGPDEEEVRPGG
jgi:alkylation response protein AidB-like acyl-CoA dehydrogenase